MLGIVLATVAAVAVGGPTSPLTSSPVTFRLDFLPSASTLNPLDMSTAAMEASTNAGRTGGYLEQTVMISNAAWDVQYYVNVSSAVVATYVTASLLSTAADSFASYAEAPIASSASSGATAPSSLLVVMEDSDGNPWMLRPSSGAWTLGFDKRRSRVVLNLSSVPERVHYSVTEFMFAKPGSAGSDSLCTRPQGYKCCQLTATSYGLFTLVSATDPVTCTLPTISAVQTELAFSLSVSLGAANNPTTATAPVPGIGEDPQLCRNLSAGSCSYSVSSSIPSRLTSSLFAVCRNGGSIGSPLATGNLFFCPQWLFGSSARQVGYNVSTYVNDRTCNGAPLGFYSSPTGDNAEQFSRFRNSSLSFFLPFVDACAWDGGSTEHSAVDGSGSLVTYLDSISLDCNNSGTFSIRLSTFVPSSALTPRFNLASIDNFYFAGWTRMINASNQSGSFCAVLSLSLRALFPQASPPVPLMAVVATVACGGFGTRLFGGSSSTFQNVTQLTTVLNVSESLAPKLISLLLSISATSSSLLSSSSFVSCTASIQQPGLNTSRLYTYTSSVSSRRSITFDPTSKPLPSTDSLLGGDATMTTLVSDAQTRQLLLSQNDVYPQAVRQCLGDLFSNSDGGVDWCHLLDDAGCNMKYGAGWYMFTAPLGSDGVCRAFSPASLPLRSITFSIAAAGLQQLVYPMWKTLFLQANESGSSSNASTPAMLPPPVTYALYNISLPPWIALPDGLVVAASQIVFYSLASSVQVSPSTQAVVASPDVAPLVDSTVSGPGVASVVLIVLELMMLLAVVFIWTDCIETRLLPALREAPAAARQAAAVISGALWMCLVWCSLRCSSGAADDDTSPGSGRPKGQEAKQSNRNQRRRRGKRHTNEGARTPSREPFGASSAGFKARRSSSTHDLHVPAASTASSMYDAQERSTDDGRHSSPVEMSPIVLPTCLKTSASASPCVNQKEALHRSSRARDISSPHHGQVEAAHNTSTRDKVKQSARQVDEGVQRSPLRATAPQSQPASEERRTGKSSSMAARGTPIDVCEVDGSISIG